MAIVFRDSDGTARLYGDLVAPGGATGDVLTQQADGTYAPAAGGSQPVQIASVTLERAEIWALPTTPVELVAAPGAGKFIHCGSVYGESGVVLSLQSSTNFTNVSADTVFGVYLGANRGVAGLGRNYPAGASFGFLNWGGPLVGPLGVNWDPGSGSLPILSPPNDYAYVVDKPLTFDIDNSGDGDLTGGGADDTLTIVAVYSVLTLP